MGPRRQPRPLDRLNSIRVKLGTVVVLSVAATVGAIFLSIRVGVPARFAFGLGLLVSLLLIQLLAHGILLPLREMANATEAMAKGDYSMRVTATSQDEVGLLARSFNEMAGQLDEVELQRQELIANVSHELRTPIASLRARLENLADGVEPLDHDAVGGMLRTTERLGSLVGQLLELSKFESGTVRLDRAPIPLEAIAGTAIDEVTPLRGDVHVCADVTPNLTANIDRVRVLQVLTNLLSNALRHSPPGGSVHLIAAAIPAGVRLEIVDEGPGIPEAELARVFDRFHRVDSARSSATGGTGLGLAIAQSIVELHGGSIHAETNQPRGCRMVIELPD